MLKADRQRRGVFSVLKISGRLFQKETPLLRNILERELNAENYCVAMDLSRITQVSSLALGMIVKYWNRFRAQGGRLVILNPSPVIRELMEHTKLCTVIAIVENEEALKELKG